MAKSLVGIENIIGGLKETANALGKSLQGIENIAKSLEKSVQLFSRK